MLVRCGVDDAPKSIVGAAIPAFRDLPAEPAKIGILLKPRFIPDPFPNPPQGGARAPLQRSPLVVALATPEARVDVRGATRSGRPLPPSLERGIVGAHFDIQSCLGAKPIPTADLGLRVRVASSGAPVTSAVLTSPLEDDVSRCVAEIACRLTVPAGETIDDLALSVSLAPVVPVYKGTVNIGATTDVPAAASAKQRAALADIVKIIQPTADACAKQHPPAAPFVLPLRLTIYANRLGSQMPAMGGAVFDFARCFVPKIGELVGPMHPSLRKEKFVRVEVSVPGHER